MSVLYFMLNLTAKYDGRQFQHEFMRIKFHCVIAAAVVVTVAISLPLQIPKDCQIRVQIHNKSSVLHKNYLI